MHEDLTRLSRYMQLVLKTNLNADVKLFMIELKINEMLKEKNGNGISDTHTNGNE